MNATLRYRGQYRPPGAVRWLTHSERGSASGMWDELLIDPTIQRGSDLRVIAIRPAGPGTFRFSGIEELPSGPAGRKCRRGFV